MKNMKSMLFKTIGILLVLSMVFAFTTITATAQTYPTKPIRFIIPVPPGGINDIMARLIGPPLSKRLGVPVVMDNHGGASHILGTEIAAKSAPDGYTLVFISGAHTVTAAFYKLPYDPVKSFVPVAKVPGGDMLFVVHPSLRVNSVKDFIVLANKQPGKLIFASPAAGSNAHMSIELFKSMAGIDVKIVQFKGAGPAMTDLLGSHSHAMINSVASCLSHINSGKLRALATCGVKRSVVLPDVPTIAEAGLPGFEATTWYFILAADGTPQAIVDRLNKEFSVILSSAEMQVQLAAQGAEVDKMTLAEFRPFIAAEVAKWKRIVKEANIKVEQ
jgi:tripartite-type tricarboxylate transporter receptor subunit TctC